MLIVDVIPTANSEYVIYFLLAAYLEATQFGRSLPEYVTNLPITGLKDVETRFQRLIVELRRTSAQQRERARLEIDEALRIFDAALQRLKFLERKKQPLKK